MGVGDAVAFTTAARPHVHRQHLPIGWAPCDLGLEVQEAAHPTTGTLSHAGFSRKGNRSGCPNHGQPAGTTGATVQRPCVGSLPGPSPCGPRRRALEASDDRRPGRHRVRGPARWGRGGGSPGTKGRRCGLDSRVSGTGGRGASHVSGVVDVAGAFGEKRGGKGDPRPVLEGRAGQPEAFGLMRLEIVEYCAGGAPSSEAVVG